MRPPISTTRWVRPSKKALGADTGAHRILLDLSQATNGNVQLVTTNFDLLFEAAAPRLPVWTPDHLPDLRRGTFDGIVHLHGMLNPAYERAVGGNLVLSSAEFGRAYLSEGWATRFIREAAARYTVVFVGYTADDPPVQYLLEALRRDQGLERQPMYAFQPGLQAEAAALWTHKGVTAIPYDEQSHHAALWQTLAAWAERARDPEAWRKSILHRAQAGPEVLAPHERGQVMHLAMTRDGVKSIVTAKRKLSANWLLVFDPAERYETPGRRLFTAEEAAIDSFFDYCLDSDPRPKPDDSGTIWRQREVPEGALDALVANAFDPPSQERGAIHGDGSVALISLPPRLQALTAWIASIAEQPLVIWWALNKPHLHPVLLQIIEGRFRRKKDRMPNKARLAWRTILEARRPRFRSAFHNIYDLQERIAEDGWTPAARRSLVAFLRPQLKVTRPLAQGPVKDIARAPLPHIMNVSLDYQDNGPHMQVPDDQLTAVTPLARRLLEEVSTQEAEISFFALSHIPSIHFDPKLAGMAYERDHGFNRLVFWYIRLFERLLALEPLRARREFDAWVTQDNTLFSRLRVWACSLANFLPADVATQTLATLDDDAFWTDRGQRDLLLALKARWQDFDVTLRRGLEKRLLKGPPRWKGISKEKYRQWGAHEILSRVLWLQGEGCSFLEPVAGILARARTNAPQWQDTFAEGAADSHEGRGGTVGSDRDIDHLRDTPIRDLLAAGMADSGRDHAIMVERDPIGGLAEKLPIKLLRALLLDGLPSDQVRRWAWSKFLQSEARRKDAPRRVCLIAHRLAAVPDAVFVLIIPLLTHWLEMQAKALYQTAGTTLQILTDRIATTLEQPVGDKQILTRQADWLSRAVFSPSGQMLDVLFHDPDLEKLGVGAGLPVSWRERVERYLALPGDHGYFALYQVAYRLWWLCPRDAGWAERHVLAKLDSESEAREVVLTAFLYHVRWSDRAMYARLKAPILQLINGEMTRPKVDPRALTAFTVSGWREMDEQGRCFSDEEMRTALVRGNENFRTSVLWEVNNWTFQEKRDFLAQVWPLQLAARSSTVTDRLCYIAFHDPGNFAELARTVLPFLTPIRRGSLMFAAGVPNANNLIAANPEIVLEIYWRILPDDSADWPYDAREGLEHLYKNVKSVRHHPHMVELMRRRRKGYF